MPSDFDDLCIFGVQSKLDSRSSEASKNDDGVKIASVGIDESETAKLDSENFHFSESRVKLSGKGKKKGGAIELQNQARNRKKQKKGRV